MWDWKYNVTLLALSALVVRAEPVVLNIDARAPGKAISPDFIGLSYEMSEVIPDGEGRHFFSPDNQPLINLFRTLGVKSLRVGGNTADRPSVRMPSHEDIDSLFAFARKAGVKVLYTLRLNQGEPKDRTPGRSPAGSKETLAPYDPQADAATAKYILDRYADNLECFIIGNEVDHYYATFASYRDAWLRFTGAIKTPGAVFCGPSTTAARVLWAADFARELGRNPRVVFISQHEYAAGSGRIKDIAGAREKLLSPAIEQNYRKFYDAFGPAVLESGRRFRLEECNSFSNGGAAGVSDAFAAALWAVDYMYWWADHGALGLNFHTSGAPLGSSSRKSARYAAFVNSDSGYAARPLAYAMKLFDLGGHGKLVPLRSNSRDERLRAYAVRSEDGALYVTLDNRAHDAAARPISIELEAGAGFSRGQSIVLAAPDGNVDAKGGLTLGGAGIADDGGWKGEWHELRPRNGQFKFELAPASIALVKLAN